MSTGHPNIDALMWHIEEELDIAIEDAPVDRRLSNRPQVLADAPIQPQKPNPAASGALAAQRAQSAEAARSAPNIEALRQVIADYEGLDIKRTASNLVFADGNAKARVMVIGEAPGADEDRVGMPFAGETGQLFDRMFEAIGLSRTHEDAKHSLYASNILNWRPPGNRTPTDLEISLALPFIERHIALVRPDFIVVMGAVAAKALLNSELSMSRLRGKIVDYTALTPNIAEGLEGCSPKILATYHPSYLLRTPAQKRQAWQDLLMLKKALEN